MQPPAAKSRSLIQGMPLYATMGEASIACKLGLLSPRGNRSTQMHMEKVAQLLGEKYAFLYGS